MQGVDEEEAAEKAPLRGKRAIPMPRGHHDMDVILSDLPVPEKQSAAPPLKADSEFYFGHVCWVFGVLESLTAIAQPLNHARLARP